MKVIELIDIKISKRKIDSKKFKNFLNLKLIIQNKFKNLISFMF